MTGNPEQFRSVLQINLDGCYWMAQAAARVMPVGSSIINVSCVLGIVTAGCRRPPMPCRWPGCWGFTRDLSAQWTSRTGIRVNAVAPGFFASEMSGSYPPGYLDRFIGLIPAVRPGEASEIAAVIVFLALERRALRPGVTLPVDGGLTIA